MISDTHMGLGRVSEQKWEMTEDFRWPEALQEFLGYASRTYGDSIDLLVLGDFLELWQAPAGLECTSPAAELGCSPTELALIAARVVKAHASELQALQVFSKRGENRLILLPGNHDSGLLLPEVWELLKQPLDVASGRVTLATDGTWQSADKRVFAEHGHQIGRDANKYANWPAITAKRDAGTFVVRPWGERFVQKIFNEVEREYAVIDNLSPESLGIRYRIAEKGRLTAAGDAARFLMFNLFETSVKQKAQVLGDEYAAGGASGQPRPAGQRWDIAYARSLGERLPIAALDPGDPFRQFLDGGSEEAAAIRAELAEQIKRREGEDALSDAEIVQLCDHAAIRGSLQCERPQAGAMFERLLYSKEAVLRKHLVSRKLAEKDVAFYVYGHTHQLETPWDINVGGNRLIQVANTGAFQRLMDEKQFKARLAARQLAPEQALRSLTHDDMPACYTYVVVTRKDKPRMQTLRWHQPDNAAGQSVGVGDKRCE
jgi:UDP-2,3-diacylglucosamine pyrophosphatase LpxH